MTRARALMKDFNWAADNVVGSFIKPAPMKLSTAEERLASMAGQFTVALVVPVTTYESTMRNETPGVCANDD
jgi:hypothetical protein